MSAYQLDCWESPTPAQVEAAKAAVPGLYAWQGYVPGWGNPYGGGWTPEGVKAVLDAGLGYLPLLVPASLPGTNADTWDVGIIFAEHHVAAGGGKLSAVGLNVESGWSASDPVGWKADALAFAAAAARAGVASFVYGPPTFLASLAGPGVPSGVYVGEWPSGSSSPPTAAISSILSIPGIPDSEWTSPGQRIWQFRGGHQVQGLPFNCDLSLTDPGVPYCRAYVVPTPVPVPASVTLLAPTVESQLSSPTDGWDACGEADVASVVTDAGVSVTVGQVVDWALANGAASTNGETTSPQLVTQLAHWGVSAVERKEPLLQSIPAALQAGHEILVLVSSNSDGVPTAGQTIGHWLLVWGIAADGVNAMQPLGSPPGSLQVYPWALLEACDLQDAVEIDRVLTKDGGAPLAPAPTPTLLPIQLSNGLWVFASGQPFTIKED